VNDSALRVRRAGSRDAADVAAILAAGFAQHRDDYTADAFSATVLDEDRVHARLEQGPIWIAVLGGRSLGTVSAVLQDPDVYLRSLAVDPSARGQGVGRELVAAVIEWTSHVGRTRVRLDCTSFLRDATRLYLACGFRIIGPNGELNGTPLVALARDLASCGTDG
jgi:GNAT superfamily N-acetyltransferase